METTSKEEEIQQLKKQLKIAQEATDAKQMMLEMTSRHMKKVQVKLENTSKELEKANLHLTDSIRYARRIQKGIINSYLVTQSNFPDSFVYLNPKDKLSGDTPWFYTLNNQLMVAAIDCTGHGVPGAILTVLATSLLEKIVGAFQISNTSEILNQLDFQFANHILIDENFNIKDGMDIAFCKIDMEKKELEFLGTHLPLYLVRNNKLITYKGVRYSIGSGELSGKLQNPVKIKFQKGDMIFLCSDGYADQFGEITNFKLLPKNFRKILSSIAHLPMSEQRQELDKRFKEWQGNVIQTDDVLVIGMRL